MATTSALGPQDEQWPTQVQRETKDLVVFHGAGQRWSSALAFACGLGSSGNSLILIEWGSLVLSGGTLPEKR